MCNSQSYFIPLCNKYILKIHIFTGNLCKTPRTEFLIHIRHYSSVKYIIDDNIKK